MRRAPLDENEAGCASLRTRKADLLESGQLTMPSPPSIRTVTLKITIDKVPRPCYPSADVRSSISASRPGPRTSSSVVPPVSHGKQDFNDVTQFTVEPPASLATERRPAIRVPDPHSIRQNVAPANSRILCHSGFQFAQSAQIKAFVFNLFRTIWRVCAAHFSS